MAKQILNGRFALKHDVEANWQKATGFIPMEGEAIVYQPDDTHDHPRFKVGDGATGVNELAFAAGSAGRDWSQNDPSAADYIKNRTHYGTIILPETEIQRYEMEGGYSVYAIPNALPSVPEVGKDYTVIYNGTAYDSTATTENEGVQVALPFGDAGNVVMLLASGGGEEILPGVVAYGVVVSVDGSTPATLSIIDSNIKKLDPIYMHESVVMAERPVWEETVLPETEMVFRDGTMPLYLLTTPLAINIVEGETYNISFNGEKYNSAAVDATTVTGSEVTTYALGRSLNVDNMPHPNPDCPFSLLIFPDGIDVNGQTAYGEIPSSEIQGGITLSITTSANTAPKQLTMNPNGKIVWEDRTHYDNSTIVEIFSDDNPVLIEGGEAGNPSIFGSAQPVNVYPVDGEKYDVTHNGVTSTTSCVYIKDDGEGFWLLGNHGLLAGSGNTGESYIIMIPDPTAYEDPSVLDGMTAMIYDLTNFGTEQVGATTMTITVEGGVSDIKKLDPKYLPEYDWYAEKGDEGYIKNRTHWITTKEVEIYPEVEQEADSNIQVPPTNYPVDYGTYIVTYNGNEYECVAEPLRTSDGTKAGWVLGMGGMFGTINSTEDFTLAIFASPQETSEGAMAHAMLIPLKNTASPNVISVKQPAGTVHKLDKKFLPDDLFENTNFFSKVRINEDYINAEDTNNNLVILSGRDIDVSAIQGQVIQISSLLNLHNGGLTGSVHGVDAYANGNNSFAFGTNARAGGIGHTFAFGQDVQASQSHSVAFGQDTEASGFHSAAFGWYTIASNRRAFAEGYKTTASGKSSHAEGEETTASGDISHAEGIRTVASGQESHAEGCRTSASGSCSHAEGYSTSASGGNSHAEGCYTKAIGLYSHAQGLDTKVKSANGVALGQYNLDNDLTGYYYNITNSSFAVNKNIQYRRYDSTPTQDLTNGKFVYGDSTAVLGAELVVGDLVAVGNTGYYELTSVSNETDTTIYFECIKHEIRGYHEDCGTYAVMLGNGKISIPSNAHAIDWNGNAYYAGDVYVQGDGSTFGFDGKKKLATEEYVDNAMSEFSSKLILTDTVTGINYELYVENGKLAMKEIE